MRQRRFELLCSSVGFLDSHTSVKLQKEGEEGTWASLVLLAVAPCDAAYALSTAPPTATLEDRPEIAAAAVATPTGIVHDK